LISQRITADPALRLGSFAGIPGIRCATASTSAPVPQPTSSAVCTTPGSANSRNAGASLRRHLSMKRSWLAASSKDRDAT
jgi:hypothetical protein